MRPFEQLSPGTQVVVTEGNVSNLLIMFKKIGIMGH